eukprot:TRINITY_DN124_c0_g3_i1.p1 TRINITY_DN124_c0_g3~~TRINITY_DN124_c0_g3_i1.p1  ORF type:complete len:311 (-),score=7.98 TRINITY_DN124_c0_g3_i1:909-1841(-)
MQQQFSSYIYLILQLQFFCLITAMKVMSAHSRQLHQEQETAKFIDLTGVNLSSLQPGGGVPLKIPEDQPILKDIDAARISLFQILRRDVFGEDERKRIKDTLQEPFNSIGEITPIGCTGTVIGPRHVLSAAHCVVDFFSGTEYDDIYGLVFSLARNMQFEPYPIYNVESVYYPDEFISKSNDFYLHDYAVMTVDREFESDVKQIKVKNPCNSVRNYVLNIAGYPFDKPEGTMWTTACGAVWLDCDRLAFSHKCDTVNGMSGSAMFQKIGKQYVVRGIHTRGSSSGELFNYGITITKQVQKRIMEVVRSTI